MDTSMIKNVRIGEVLKEYGYVTDEQIDEAMAYQKENKGVRLGGALIALKIITERQMLEALAARLNIKYINISDMQIDINSVARIQRSMAEKYCVIAIDENESALTIVMNDPMNFYAVEDIRQITGMELNIVLAKEAPIRQAISYYYSEVSARSAANIANESFKSQGVEEIEFEDGDDDTPIINLLNSLIERAYSNNASDIHIEPFESDTIVRMRVDGVLINYVVLQKNIHSPLIARIKILSDIDIAERRVPQDGHFKMKVSEETFNIRVSTIPTVYGEKAVLRLLTNNAVIAHADKFGMDEEDYNKFAKMLKAPNGIIYMTGPTGSGKSTTLYMVLEELSKQSVNISTIEDPVEKNVSRITQMQVNNVAGLTFGIGLRALLRQDPDIIMVGETRDAETAAISVRAAITGHKVFSTIHTNDAASTVVRLADMGLERYIIASSVVGIVAQRLMRKVCPECSEDVEITPQEEVFVGRKIQHLVKGRGCMHCNYTGYRGRIAIHEILEVDANVRKMITDGAAIEEIKQYAIKEQGMKTLKESGIELMEAGVTTMEELTKVAFYS